MSSTVDTIRVARHGWRQAVIRPAKCCLAIAVLGSLLAPAITLAAEIDTTQPFAPEVAATVMTAVGSSDDQVTLDDVELYDLTVPKVVVAAGRHEQLVAELPYSITVITADDIRRAGASTVADALRLVPGMNISQNIALTPAISIRGMYSVNARDLLVLVDGRQIFDGMSGGTLWNTWPHSIEDIKQIEVIRGPAGLTWGPNAVNGVINIITKDATDEPTLEFIARAGSRGWNRDHITYSFSDERFSLRLSGEFERTDGHVRGGTEITPIDDGYLMARMNLKMTFKLSDTDELRIAGGSAIVDDGIPVLPSVGKLVTGRNQSNYLQIDWHRDIERDNQIAFTAYANDFHRLAGFTAADYRYQQIALQLTHTFKPVDAHTVTWGVDTRLDYLADSGDPTLVSRPYLTSGIVGIYAQDEWRIADEWILNAGARLDYHTYAGFGPSARVGLTRTFGEHHAVFAAVSRAVQMPPTPMNYIDLPVWGGLSRMHSAGILENEPVMTYEVGYRGHYLNGKLDLSTSLFWSEISDITSTSTAFFQRALVTRVVHTDAATRIYGGEIGAEYRPAVDWRFLAHYSYQQQSWYSSNTPFVDRDLITAPKHQFMVGAQHDLTDDLHLSAHWYFVDQVQATSPHLLVLPFTIPSYHRLDLRAEYEFWEDHAAVSVGVRNLLDDHHPEGGTTVFNDSEVPRMVFAELRLSLP